MIKTYKLTQPLRNCSFVLRGKTNNSQRFNFTGGDPLTGKAATLMLRSQYSQDLLEQSERFKKGYVKLVRTDEGGEAPVSNSESKAIPVEDVTSPEQLIEFVATKLEKVYQQPKFALKYANDKGYIFPNLTLE